VDRVACRSEFGDLVWELQGELGTSHAYDIGGDYRAEPKYFVGLLGATFKWEAAARGYVIKSLWRGDSWKSDEAGPLTAPGVGPATGAQPVLRVEPNFRLESQIISATLY